MRLAFALYGRVAGVIERDRGHTTLRYQTAYQRLRNATPLSLSMPVSDRTYSAKPVEAYLRGLLPDHPDVLDRWARKAGVKPGDWLGLVAHVGLDVSGGAVFAPEDEIEDALVRPGRLAPASDTEIAERLRRLRRDDAAWQDDEDDEHWSLAGAQSKFTLALTPDGWAHPEGSAPSTHIVKPGIGRIRSQALSEHVSMRALAIAGLPVAETHYLTFEDQDAIVVTRFDRQVRGGAVVRIHQEDLLQAFALDPRRKYESDGGPGVARAVNLLRAAAGPRSVDRFARAVIANQILGAPDAHGKNYGLLLAGPTADLTPLYDVATGLVPNTAGRLPYTKGAMSIGGERRFGDVERGNWEKFAQVAGLETEQVLTWVAELAEQLPAAFEQAASETTAPDADFVSSVVAKNVAAVARQTLQGLTGTRRAGGRIITPFMETLSEQSRGPADGQPVPERAPAGARTVGPDSGDDGWDSQQ
ncbi:type II toxin-antitoxin system HipA family toxin [Isoptericola sp. NPDC019482]|uniref:type II toxin-antitoxin system HipA family toxin n=1 Tax=Isoptericola sp. NPDC019482 TaxID=3154688 RepID=UPI00348E8491